VDQCTDLEAALSGTDNTAVAASLDVEATFVSSGDNGCSYTDYRYDAVITITDIEISSGAEEDIGPITGPIGWHHCE
jgi:hypothetical protein